MKIAYFDCFAGASGDMILGALLDAGLSLDLLKTELAKLELDHYDLQVEKVVKRGIGGSQAMVLIEQDHHHHHHRHLHHIVEIINQSGLDDEVKTRSCAIFQRLAEAEAKVHRAIVEVIHFHEVGAMDAIIDVVGAVIGFNALGIEAIYCSPLHVGSGTVTCDHGILPVPAPATAELIRGKPVYSTGVAGELLTPTGAAILTTLAAGFGPMPSMIPRVTGYGAGNSNPDIPNLLRVAIGETADAASDYDHDQVSVIETNIDDMNPQIYAHVIQELFDAGALDVFLTPVQMKKLRPGMLLTAISPLNLTNRLAEIILRQTTTIGLRLRTDRRIKLQRRFQTVGTPYGRVTVKTSGNNKQDLNHTPEYEDCKKLAMANDVPLKTVMAAANQAIMAGDVRSEHI